LLAVLNGWHPVAIVQDVELLFVIYIRILQAYKIYTRVSN